MKGLLSKKNAFVWNADNTASMEAVKAIITGPQCHDHLNPKLKSMLLTDALYWIGLHPHPDRGHKLIKASEQIDHMLALHKK